MHKVYEPTTRPVDVFIEDPPLQPKRAVVEAVAALGICDTPQMFDGLDESIAFVDGSEDGDVVVRSEDPKEYVGASGIFDSPNSLRAHLENSRRPNFPFPSLEYVLLGASRIVDPLGDEDPNSLKRQYFLPQDLGKASLSYWERIPGERVVVVRDLAREDTVHIIDEDSWHARNTETGEHKDFTGSARASEDAYDHMAETFMSIEESGLFDPRAVYIAEFVVGKTGTICFLQMHHTGNVRDYSQARIPKGEFTHEWHKASLVMGATDGIEERVITRVASGNDLEGLRLDSLEVDLSIHPSVGTDERNILGLYARTQFHRVDGRYVASEISNGGHGGRSLVFKPPLSIAPTYEDITAYDSNPMDAPEFALEVASDGHDAYYRTHA